MDNKTLSFVLIIIMSLTYIHDDVIKWKNSPRYWPFVRGIHRSPVNSPHKGQWRGALMFSLICAWINSWVNNRDAGDLRRHRPHYDVILRWTLPVVCMQDPCDKAGSRFPSTALEEMGLEACLYVLLCQVGLSNAKLVLEQAETQDNWTCFLSLTRSKLRLCSANHRAG